MDHDLDCLFAPLQIRGKNLKNRFVLPAMQLGWTVDNAPDRRLIDYYGRCASGGIALVITEGLVIDHPSATWNNGGYLTHRTAPDWQRACDAVHQHGSLFFTQLFHEGGVRMQGKGGPFPDYPTLSPSGLYKKGKQNGEAASLAQLAEIRDAYVEAALLAQSFGADGIEIHSAHGYFLDLFLWPETNLRDDDYGGDLERRARYPASIVEAIRAATGEEFIISFRFSQWKEVDYDATIIHSPEELQDFVEIVRAAGADILHASTRRFYKPEWPSSKLGLAGWVKKCADKDAIVIANGSVGLTVDVMNTFFGQDEIQSSAEHSARELANRMRNREFDLISVGRSVIGDQDWVNKIKTGRFNEITTFTRSMISGTVESWDPGLIGEEHKN